MAPRNHSTPANMSRRSLLKAAAARAESAPPGSFAFSGHDRAHAHMIQADTSGRFVLHVDLGLDRIFVWRFDNQRRVLTPGDSHEVALPPGYAGSNFCSEILVSADGRFVYRGNRLHDSIGIFAVGRTGELTFVADEPTRGDYPRSFAVDPANRFLHCCNQRADNVTVFRVDPKTGGLAFTGHYTPMGNPSSIVFADIAKAG